MGNMRIKIVLSSAFAAGLLSAVMAAPISASAFSCTGEMTTPADVAAADDTAYGDDPAGANEPTAADYELSDRIIQEAHDEAVAHPEQVALEAALEAVNEGAESIDEDPFLLGVPGVDPKFTDFPECGGQPGPYYPFTAANFGANLGIRTGVNPRLMKDVDAHHGYPQKFAKDFARLYPSLNIHNPRYGSWWNASQHRSLAYEYNLSWQNFLKRDPAPSQIRGHFNRLVARCKLNVPPLP